MLEYTDWCALRAPLTRRAPVAHRIERLPAEQEAASSILARRTTLLDLGRFVLDLALAPEYIPAIGRRRSRQQCDVGTVSSGPQFSRADSEP
jgi:hypothetical protein